MSLSQPTCNHYIDILSATFMMRQLSPWFENIKKRQIKSRKIYFRDSGIYHALLGLENQQGIIKHPKLGASWEGFALEEIIRRHKAREETCFYWATQGGAELGLLICQQGKKIGFEFKFNDAPQISKSMRIAMEDLKLDSLTIVYPGDKNIQLEDNIYLSGLEKVSEKITET
jgi:predicted AAA+ superfamily ATPase